MWERGKATWCRTYSAYDVVMVGEMCFALGTTVDSVGAEVDVVR